MECVWAQTWAWETSSVNVVNSFGDSYQQLWLFFHHPILFNAFNFLFLFKWCLCYVCKCVLVVMVFLTTFFFHSLIFLLFFLARSFAWSVVNVLLLLLLFYCRLRFCILHKWINYVFRAQTQTHSHTFTVLLVVVFIHSFDFMPWIRMCGDVFVSSIRIENWLLRGKIFVPSSQCLDVHLNDITGIRNRHRNNEPM